MAYFQEVADDPEGKASLDEWTRVKDPLLAGKAKVEAVLAKWPAGESSNAIEFAARLSRKRTHAAIAALAEEGVVVQTEVQKDAGRSGTRPYSGYRLAEPNPNEDAECNEADGDDDVA